MYFAPASKYLLVYLPCQATIIPLMPYVSAYRDLFRWNIGNYIKARYLKCSYFLKWWFNKPLDMFQDLWLLIKWVRCQVNKTVWLTTLGLLSHTLLKRGIWEGKNKKKMVFSSYRISLHANWTKLVTFNLCGVLRKPISKDNLLVDFL